MMSGGPRPPACLPTMEERVCELETQMKIHDEHMNELNQRLRTLEARVK